MRRGPWSLLIVLGTAQLATGPAFAEDRLKPAPSAERTIEALVACGVPKAQARITYEEELQSEVVRIGDLGGSDEARFQCVRNAVPPVYMVDASAAPQWEAYGAFTRREDDALDKAWARRWLEAAGLIDRVPKYIPGRGLAEFARSVEAACALRKGSALEVSAVAGLTLRPSFLAGPSGPKAEYRFACLMHMIAASDVDQHGVHLGFVGNEFYDPGNQR